MVPMSAGGAGVNMGAFGAIEFQTNAAASVYSKGPFTNTTQKSIKQSQRKRASEASKTAGVSFMPAS